MDGIPALDPWDLVIEVFPSSTNQLKKNNGRVQGDLLRYTPSIKHTKIQTKTPIQHDDHELCKDDYVPSKGFCSSCVVSARRRPEFLVEPPAWRPIRVSVRCRGALRVPKDAVKGALRAVYQVPTLS